MEPTTPVPAYIAAVLRAALQAGGGWLVAHGYLQSDQVSQLIGGGLVLAALLWSVIQKRNAHTDTKTLIGVIDAKQTVIESQSAAIRSQGTSANAPSSTAGG